MDLIVADDSKQNKPSRPGMGPLVAFGGIHVPGEAVRMVEAEIGSICKSFGFPDSGDHPGHPPNYGEFKWSPNADQWMHDNLLVEKRKSFFTEVLRLLHCHGVSAMVALRDTSKNPATKDRQNKQKLETDVTWVFLERANSRLRDCKKEGLVIVDRPGGNSGNEEKLLEKCQDVLYQGTKYVKFDKIALNVVCTSSHLVRLLQAADLVVSCTTAYIGGESPYSPPVFDQGIRPLLRSADGCVGGYGLKLHPDFRYANLYHWLLGDTALSRRGTVLSLPCPDRPYSTGPNCP